MNAAGGAAAGPFFMVIPSVIWSSPLVISTSTTDITMEKG